MKHILIILISLILVLYYLIKLVFKTDLNKLNIFAFTIIYLIFLFMILFNREKTDDSLFSDGTYIKKWIKIIFINKTVFINIIGNIIIFIPLGVLLSIYRQNLFVSIMIIIAIIIAIESMQYFTKRGIFDILDILLNMIGSILGYTLDKIYILIRKRGEKYG